MNYRKMDDIKPLPRVTYYPSSVPVTSPNQIFRANDYESYILRQPPKRNVTYVSNTYIQIVELVNHTKQLMKLKNSTKVV